MTITRDVMPCDHNQMCGRECCLDMSICEELVDDHSASIELPLIVCNSVEDGAAAR